MGNCLVGKDIQNVETEEEVKRKGERNNPKIGGKKVKIILTREELEKLMLFQLTEDDGEDRKMRSLGDFLRELEVERSAAEAAAVAMAPAGARQGYGGWRPKLERIMECPEEDFSYI